MNKKPYILITNDDGIHAPGIKHLYNALKPYADCVVSAPFVEKSGAALSTTFSKPLQIHDIAWNDDKAYRINGTPSDCVKLAVSVLLKRKPDIIVSGINQGSNAGRNVLYSGTIGAVMEGVYKNIPGIAFSCVDLKEPNFSRTEKYIYPIVEYFLNNPLDKWSLINVNFPSDKIEEIKGIKMAKQGNSFSIEMPEKRLHPEGHSYYWMGGKWLELEEEESSDVHYLNQGYITVVPISISQLTCEKQFQKHQTKIETLFS